MDSALSRTISISLDDRNGRRVVRSSGFFALAPITTESRLRKLAREGGNWSQRMNRRLSPYRSSIRSSWRTASAMDVFPIPPGPTRATGVRSEARQITFSITSPRPKQTLGGAGGNSPAAVLWIHEMADSFYARAYTDLVGVYEMISESSRKGTTIRPHQLMLSHIGTFLNYLNTTMNVH